MNVTCKRLLSWLVVLTMVLSMVPVFDLSNFAVTTKAATENPGQAVINAAKNLGKFEAPTEGYAITKECPVCGGEQTWKSLNLDTSATANNLMGHYYLTADWNSSITLGNSTLCFNLNGYNITNASGTAISASRSHTLNLIDTVGSAIVTGKGNSSGSALNLNGPTDTAAARPTVNIYGGTLKKTDDATSASVVGIGARGGTVNMYAGTVNAEDVSNAKWPTTISMMGAANAANAIFNLYGGEIKCGTMTDTGVSCRGNIMVGYSGYTNGAVFNVKGGTVVGGTSTNNYSGGTFAVLFNNTLNISGGTIYGGTGTVSGGNIFSLNGNYPGTINISGGTIAGEIFVGNNIQLNLSGDPQIVTSLELENGETVTATRGLDVASVSNSNLIDINELTADANIVVTGDKSKVFAAASDNAANVVKCFSHTTATLDVFVNGSNQLYINDKQAEVGTFDPWNCVNNAAYCQACSEQQGKPVLVENWTALSGATARTSLSTGHYYLAENNTTGFTRASGATVCLELNGMDVTVKDKVFGNMTTAGTLNIMDRAGKATVAGWQSTYTGEVFDLRSSAAYVNIYGGTFKKHAEASTKGSIIYYHTGGNVNMHGGTIDASGVENSGYSPSVHMVGAANNVATFNMHGGEIKNGSTGNTAGGNIVVGAGTANTAVFNLYGGTVSGGSTKNVGGNFYVNAGQLNIDGGTVKDGTSTGSYSAAAGGAKLGGGNIALGNGGKLCVISGTISGGEATNACGGNIYVRDNATGKIEISGGKIVNGEAKVDGDNICVYSSEEGSELTISGGAIGGGIHATAATAITLSGEPVIKTNVDGQTVEATTGLEVTNDSNMNVDGLAEGAEIQVTGEIGVAFTPASEKAAGVVGCFTTTDAATKVVVEKNRLKIYDADINVPEVGKFDPVHCGGMAYCPYCNNADPVKWTAISGENLDTITFANSPAVTVYHHYYLSGDVSFTKGGISFDGNNNALCLHLNGNTLTAGGIAINSNYGNTINIMGEGTVSGTAANGGATINVSNLRVVVNILGGTFKNVEGATGAVIGIGAGGGTVNMYEGATIDAEGVTSSAWATAVSIMGDGNDAELPGVFNMYGGEIKCGTTSTNRGNIMVGYDPLRANGATFNLMGGTVYGGTNTENSYGTFLVQYGGTLNVTGGKVYGGTAKGAGANIFLSGNADYTATLNASGGEICGDVYANQYAIVNLSDDAKIVKEMTVGEETVTAEGTGLYIFEGALVNIDGLTADAEVYVAGKLDTALTTGNGDTSGIYAYDPSQYTEDVDGAVYLRKFKVAVVVGEDKSYYNTTAEAIAKMGNGYIELHADGLTISISDVVYVDANGYSATVNGIGTLYAMDTANDDYEGAANWTVEEGATVEFATDVINPVNGNRYIVIYENGKYSAHRIQMYLTGISLRPSAAGLYYKAAYKCDSALAKRVKEYGIVYNAFDAITAFDAENNVPSIATDFATKYTDGVATGTSVLVTGIFKETNKNADNVGNGETEIRATPYINVDIDGDGVAEQYALANVEANDHNAAYLSNNGTVHAAMSLYDVLKTMNDKWNEEKYGAVKEFYSDWNGKGIEAWAEMLPIISGYTAPEAEA